MSEAHHLARRYPHLVATFLLQGACHERCAWRLAIRFFFNTPDTECDTLQSVAQLVGADFVDDHDAVFCDSLIVKVFAAGNAGAVNIHQGGGETWLCRGDGFKIPVASRDVCHTLLFAFNYQSNGGTLDASSRESAIHFAPQDGRYLVTVQTIKNAPSLGGIH